jgi:hypothetical protein
MGYQFLHVETYSETPTKVRGTKAHFNTAGQVLGEAMRTPKYSQHVEVPRDPYKIGGTLSVSELQATRAGILESIRENVVKKGGGSYQRKLRKDAATLYTEIHSHPLPVETLRKDSQKHMPIVEEWIKHALSDFKDRMPEGIDWSAVMHLDEGYVHFHILAINTNDSKLDANKLHAGKVAAAKLRSELVALTAIEALPKPDIEKRPNKPKQPRPSKNRETQKKNNAKREAQLAAWEKECKEVAVRNRATLNAWEDENAEHLKLARKARGAVPEKEAYTAAMKGLQDRYYERVGKPCGLLRDGPRAERLSTKQYAAKKAVAAKMKDSIEQAKMTLAKAEEEAGYALDVKERLQQKEAELDAGIAAMDELVTRISLGEVEVAEDGIIMDNMPPFLKRLFGPSRSETKIAGLFRKVVHLIGSVGGRASIDTSKGPEH